MPLFHTLTCQGRCPPSNVPDLTTVHGVGAPLSQAQMTICDFQLRLNLVHPNSAHQQPETKSKDGLGWGGCKPGPPRPYDLGWNWNVCGWTSADNEGSCWRHRTLGRFLSHSSPPLPYSLNPNSLNLPGVSGRGLWLC